MSKKRGENKKIVYLWLFCQKAIYLNAKFCSIFFNPIDSYQMEKQQKIENIDKFDGVKENEMRK